MQRAPRKDRLAPVRSLPPLLLTLLAAAEGGCRAPDRAASPPGPGGCDAERAARLADEDDAREIARNEAKGLAFYGDRWIPAGEAGLLRARDREVVGWDLDLRLDTPRFRIYSGKPLSYTRRIVSILESAHEGYRERYAAVWKLEPAPKPLVVYLCGDRATFEKAGEMLTRGTDGAAVDAVTAAFYTSGAGVLCLGEAARASADKRPRDSAHELTHALDHLLAGHPWPALPAWVSEGRGEYYGYSVIGRQVLPGLARFHLRDGKPGLLVRSLPGISLRRIVDAGWDAFNQEAAYHYPPSWAFVHFLYHAERGRYAPGFRRFLSGLPARATPGDLESALGATLEELEPRFKRYVLDVLVPLIEASRIPE